MKRITIPNGYNIVIIDSNYGLKEIKPQYYKKLNGCYIYPEYRVYFKLKPENYINSSKIRPNANTHVYLPLQKIKTVLIDSSVGDYKQGRVFIRTRNPIRVKQIR